MKKPIVGYTPTGESSNSHPPSKPLGRNSQRIQSAVDVNGPRTMHLSSLYYVSSLKFERGTKARVTSRQLGLTEISPSLFLVGMPFSAYSFLPSHHDHPRPSPRHLAPCC